MRVDFSIICLSFCCNARVCLFYIFRIYRKAYTLWMQVDIVTLARNSIYYKVYWVICAYCHYYTPAQSKTMRPLEMIKKAKYFPMKIILKNWDVFQPLSQIHFLLCNIWQGAEERRRKRPIMGFALIIHHHKHPPPYALIKNELKIDK